MARERGIPSTDDDAPVRVATFPNPYEAELARLALASQRIDSVLHHDHGQYSTAASWVQLAVARRDRELAEELLERGPLGAAAGEAEPDDMGPMRLERRFAISRWFLYWGTLNLVLTGLLLPLSVIPLVLAVGSRHNPRLAFGSAFLAQVPACIVAFATSGLLGLGTLIPLLAFYFGWSAAAPEPPERLWASPLPRMPSVAIGDAWQTEPVSLEPGESPLWMLHVWGVFLLVVIALSVLGALFPNA